MTSRRLVIAGVGAAVLCDEFVGYGLERRRCRAVYSGSQGQSSFFFFSSRRRHTRFDCDWSSDVCSSDLHERQLDLERVLARVRGRALGNPCERGAVDLDLAERRREPGGAGRREAIDEQDRKSTRLNSSHSQISYAVFCLKKKKIRYT